MITPEGINEVLQNLDKLDACAGPHDFRDCTPAKRMGKYYECSKCGGMVDQRCHDWYQRGLKHGKV